MLCLIFDCSTCLGLIIFGYEVYGFDFLGLNLLGLFIVFMVFMVSDFSFTGLELEFRKLEFHVVFFSLIPHQTYTSWTSSLLNSILGWNSIFPNSSSKNSVHN